ncbi:SLATT domain-containing protein [Streptomyces sp. cmx-4-9]|uniref:SLATT domain-containing protein n=1 Tax=Streptomyces sp. cmx-4-9 TaxID=2790941 RepID=UPI00397FEDEC
MTHLSMRSRSSRHVHTQPWFNPAVVIPMPDPQKPHPDGSAYRRLEAWCHDMRMSYWFHECTATSFSKRGRYLAAGAFILSTLVGAAIFSTLESLPSMGWKITAGLLSALSAVLTGIQALLKYPELASLHHQTAASLFPLIRRAEIELAQGPPSPDTLESIGEEWGKMQYDMPDVSERIKRRISKRVDQQIASAEQRSRGESQTRRLGTDPNLT